MERDPPPLFAATPLRLQASSPSAEEAHRSAREISPSAHERGKLWWSPAELKVLLDDDAEEIRQLHAAVDALLTENTQLRREIAILRTPADVYETVFSPKQQPGSSTRSNSAIEGETSSAAQKASELLAVLRCGAKIRATEASIINTGAEAALYRHQCAALTAETANARKDVVQLQVQLKNVQSVLVEQDATIKEWVARCDGKDELLKNEKHAKTAAQQIANDLQALVHELRQALTTERERCALLETDATMLRKHNDELQVLERHQMNISLVHQALQQELRATKSRCDHARIRVVQLEMELERAGLPPLRSHSGGRAVVADTVAEGAGALTDASHRSNTPPRVEEEEGLDDDRLSHLL